MPEMFQDFSGLARFHTGDVTKGGFRLLRPLYARIQDQQF